MKKIFYFIASAIVALGAVACQNEIEDGIDAGQQTEGLSIKVTIDDQTRVSLGELEEGKGRKLTFTEGDVLVVRSGWQEGTNYLFEYAKTEDDVYTFTCTADGVSELVGTNPNVFYLGGLHEQADDLIYFGCLCNTAAESIEGIGMYADTSNFGEEGNTITMSTMPLLKFTAKEPVTFSSDSYIFFANGGWANEYTTTNTGEIYLPTITSSSDDCTVTVTTESGFEKSFTKKLEENTIYNLGTIEAEVVEPTTIYLVPGQWANDGAWFAVYLYGYATPELAMTKTEDGYYTCDIPNGVTTFSFWRMNPASSDITEANRWNEISNVSVPTDENNYYIWANWETGGAWGTKPAENTWGIVGVNGDWNNDIDMEKVSAGLYKATKVTMTAYEEWKIRANGAWDLSYTSSITGIAANRYVATSTSGSNTSVAKDGDYDIYLDIVNNRIYVMTTGTDYTTATEQTSSIAQVTGVPVEDGYIYVKLNSNWASAGWIAAYFCNGTAAAKWVRAEAVEGVNRCYKVKLPGTAAEYKNVIFCRMNSNNTTTMGWSNKWDQTNDLTWEGKNLYTIADGAWSHGAGTWTLVETL